MLYSWTFISFILIGWFITHNATQTTKIYTMCEDTLEDVPTGSSGVIQYNEGVASSRNCYLQLRFGRDKKLIYLVGVQNKTLRFIDPEYPSIEVNQQRYYITQRDSSYAVVSASKLVIKISQQEPSNFSFHFYSKVETICNDFDILVNSPVESSGILASSSPLSRCRMFISLRGLTTPHAVLKFELLSFETERKASLPIQLTGTDKQTRLQFNETQKVLLVTSNKQQRIKVVVEKDVGAEDNIVIRYTVLHCSQLPGSNSGKFPTASDPKRLREVRNYDCIDGFRPSKQGMPISCLVNSQKQIAQWTKNICLENEIDPTRLIVVASCCLTSFIVVIIGTFIYIIIELKFR